MAQTLGDKYSISALLSCGTFGQVFEALDLSTNTKVAIKREIPNMSSSKTFKNETKVLTALQGIAGVPKYYWHGKASNVQLIVMELFEKDVAHYLRMHKKLSLKTVLSLGVQLTQILQQMHQRNFVHRDIKPENVMYGKSRFYLVDYGISKSFVKNGKLIARKSNKSFIGTNKYAPIASHEGFEQYPKDDLESLIYLLIYCLKGCLPWEGQADQKITGHCKRTVSQLNLFMGCPKQFSVIYTYVRNLKIGEHANYGFIIEQLEKVAQEQSILLDNVYDWSKAKHDAQKQPQMPTLDIFNELNLQSPSTPHQFKTIKSKWVQESMVNYSESSSDEDILEKKYSQLQNLQFQSKELLG